jgi:DNA polymerase sigma
MIILDARVPIIKCDFELPNGPLNCDISTSSLHTSFRMSKLFWTYSQLDSRIAPLVFLVRAWAGLFKITTNMRPSPNLTNFQLTVLTLNFLLRIDKPLIVSLDSMSKRDADGVFLNPNMTVNSLRSMLRGKNTQSLNSLFLAFLNYYAAFDFDSYAITLDESMRLKTREERGHALCIQNPFEPDLNAAVNLRIKQLNHFLHCCDTSSRMIESIRTERDEFDLENFFRMAVRHAESLEYDPAVNESSEINDLMNT